MAISKSWLPIQPMNDGSVSRERSESATKIQNSVHGFRNDKTIKVFACPSLLQFFFNIGRFHTRRWTNCLDKQEVKYENVVFYIYILLSTQNRSLALFRHATSPPPPQVKGRSIATGSRKDKFERMNYFSKVSSDTCMTIKKPKGLFLSILNKFSTPYLIDAKYTASLKKN